MQVVGDRRIRQGGRGGARGGTTRLVVRRVARKAQEGAVVLGSGPVGRNDGRFDVRRRERHSARQLAGECRRERLVSRRVARRAPCGQRTVRHGHTPLREAGQEGKRTFDLRRIGFGRAVGEAQLVGDLGIRQRGGGGRDGGVARFAVGCVAGKAQGRAVIVGDDLVGRRDRRRHRALTQREPCREVRGKLRFESIEGFERQGAPGHGIIVARDGEATRSRAGKLPEAERAACDQVVGCPAREFGAVLDLRVRQGGLRGREHFCTHRLVGHVTLDHHDLAFPGGTQTIGGNGGEELQARFGDPHGVAFVGRHQSGRFLPFERCGTRHDHVATVRHHGSPVEPGGGETAFGLQGDVALDAVGVQPKGDGGKNGHGQQTRPDPAFPVTHGRFFHRRTAVGPPQLGCRDPSPCP